MKNSTFKTNALLLVLSMSVLSTTAQVKLKPVGMAATELRANADKEETVLLDEDFSLFTAGTEDEPDNKNVSDNFTGEIPSYYTKAPGWQGAAIRQAGGVCAMVLGNFSTSDGGVETLPGYLITPKGNYAGDLTVTFRARLLGNETESDKMTVALIHSEKGTLENSQLVIGKTWEEYSVTFSKGEFRSCALEFSMYSAAVLLDDIKVVSKQTSIIPPVPAGATDFNADGFTANWYPTKEAESYLLSLYEMNMDKATTSESFDGINSTADGMVDSSNPNYPEGWQIVLAQGDGIQLSNVGYEGSQALVMGETNDWLQTPYIDGKLVDFKFYARNISGNPVNASTIKVNVMLDNDEWYELGRIDIERISTQGEFISVANSLEDNIHRVAIVFEKHANDTDKDPMIAIDQISYMVQPETVPVFVDKELTDTFYVAKGLDAAKDYCYTVKAKNTEFTSAASDAVPALGLAVPVLSVADGVSDNQYTARWQAVPKADGYYVRNFRVYTVDEPEETVVLHEDFAKATQGTQEMPYNDVMSMFGPKSLDAYTTLPGWLGQNYVTIPGMLGGNSGAGSFSKAGTVQTPALKLDGNGGKFKVEVTMCGGLGTEEDSLVIQAGSKVYKRLYFSGEYEPTTLTAEFDCGEADMPLLIYTYKGSMFFIDDIKVSQELASGSQIITEEANGFAWGNQNTAYTFSNLEQGEHENFGYRVYAYRLFCGQEVYSPSGEMALVDLNGTTDGIDMAQGVKGIFAVGRNVHVVLDQPQAVEVYDVSGRKCVDAAGTAGTNVYVLGRPGVYVVKSGGMIKKIVIR